MQIGGSDQWGNIASGTEFIRRKAGERGQVYGITIPLLVDKDGQKFGKSTGGGALWLDPAKTTPFQLYQYLLNTGDAEVEDLLWRLTYLENVDEILENHSAALEKRNAQKQLAKALVGMIHGDDAVAQVLKSTDSFFTRPISDVCKLSESEFLEHFANSEILSVESSDKLTISGLVQQVGLRKTRADVKRLIQQKGL